MPLPNGTLTEDEFEKVAQQLLKHWGGQRKPCRSCGSDRYFIHPELFGNRSDTVTIGSPHTRLPTVGVYCAQCGLLDHYVARVLGVEVNQAKKPEESGT